MSEANPPPTASPKVPAGTASDAAPAATNPGPLCLVGGVEWTEGCTFDQELWEAAGRPEVVVLPTAGAYEHPARQVEAATAWFAGFGAQVRGLMVLARPDAEEAEAAAVVADAGFVYLGAGSALHLRSVLKDTAVWSAVERAWAGGAVIAGSAAGAMVLGDPMVDPRGGALTLGLGLIDHLALLPHYDTWSQEKAERTVELATGHLRIAAIDERTALLREPDGTWRTAGVGGVTVYVDGRPAGIEVLSSAT
ncbi:MAG: Type 1 glutamine amidotransferase-like domain-containing protein [Actinomycetota bacterium]|nr:Type 1 glutamine amidotransferase-like domain-containing protein [Actinomycetota bacterium]